MILQNKRFTVRVNDYYIWNHDYTLGVLIGDNFTYEELEGFVKVCAKTVEMERLSRILKETGRFVQYMYADSYDYDALYTVCVNNYPS